MHQLIQLRGALVQTIAFFLQEILLALYNTAAAASSFSALSRCFLDAGFLDLPILPLLG
jgi:hypothetical protein